MKYIVEAKEPKKVLLKDVHNGSIFRISPLTNELFIKLNNSRFDIALQKWNIESHFDGSPYCPIINLSNGGLRTMNFLDYVYPVVKYEFKVSI